MSDFDGLLADLKQFEEGPESPGFDLRLDLADIICLRLKEKGWSQAKLAAEIGRPQSYVTRIVHSGANCTFETAGRILFALGVKAKLIETPSTHCGKSAPVRTSSASSAIIINEQGTVDVTEKARQGSTHRTGYYSTTSATVATGSYSTIV